MQRAGAPFRGRSLIPLHRAGPHVDAAENVLVPLGALCGIPAPDRCPGAFPPTGDRDGACLASRSGRRSSRPPRAAPCSATRMSPATSPKLALAEPAAAAPRGEDAAAPMGARAGQRGTPEQQVWAEAAERAAQDPAALRARVVRPRVARVLLARPLGRAAQLARPARDPVAQQARDLVARRGRAPVARAGREEAAPAAGQRGRAAPMPARIGSPRAASRGSRA